MYRATLLGRKALAAAKIKVREFFRELIEGESERELKNVRVLLPPAQYFAHNSHTAVRLDARPGSGGALQTIRPSVCLRSSQCGRRGDSTGADRLPAARGLTGAGESGDPEQCFRAAAAAKRDSFHVRAGARDEQFRNGVGQRRRSTGQRGSHSILVCAGGHVAAAAAARTRSEATLKRTQYDVTVAAADAYVTLVAAQETVRAAQAGVDRAEVLSGTISALVNARLRPGADASRAQAELAAARTQMIQAQQAVEVARANLSQFVGMEPARSLVSAPKLLQLPPRAAAAPLDTAANPIARSSRMLWSSR